ncbi:MAG TPA: tetratricopeptide repeat protein [Gemmataceae bacterium]|jgi:serine/threonine protein kinase/Tfp pilus assembly protein PilF|nr:tetratricopeptide repeat protein [Gemmataceae bacterium]
MAAHPEFGTMNEEAIFLEALQKPTPEARAAFLAVACVDRPELRLSVNMLLKAHEQAGRFLEKGPDLGVATIDEPPVTERPGTVIGPYKLLEQIGEGGFGVVFMAEQQHPIRRKVALKVLKPGMDTRQVVARFEAERQALALMDHPNIARVIDGGETGSARPYFVMELVKGIPITEYCDQNQLTPRERLELFIHVCQAVQHAHQKGIIHRDLKPTNMMVTLHDDKPVVKVIDFGIAKAMGQQLTDKTLFTNFAQLIGTPLYMSPEQAALSGLDIDTRSDIYCLGVLLYELLAGTTPFDKDRFKEAAYDEIRRIIREEEPPKPSMRISTLGQAATTLSTQRKSDPKRLSQLFRGELDWIVMKCLEKDRNRRYETANSLASDIQRYLHDEPVQACPPSRWYRWRKFARRYRAALATAAVVLLVMVAGVVSSTWQATRASQERAKALKEAAKAKAVNDFLKDMLAQAAPENNAVGAKVTIQEVLDKAAKRIEQNPRFAEEPEVEAAIRLTIGNTYEALGLWQESEHHLRRAVDILRDVLGPEHPETLSATTEVANALVNNSKLDEAVDVLRQAVEASRRVLGEEHRDALQFQKLLGNCLERQGELAQAEKLLQQCLRTQRRVLGEDDPDTLETLRCLGFLVEAQGRLEEAESLHRECVKGRCRIYPEHHHETLTEQDELNWVLVCRGKFAEAEPHCRKVLAEFRDLAGSESGWTLDSMNTLAALLYARGELDEAERLFNEQLNTKRRQGLHDDHATVLQPLAWLSLVNQARGKWEEAERLHRQVCQGYRRALGAHQYNTLIVIYNHAVFLHARGKLAEAGALFQEALQVLPPEHPWTAQALSAWGNFLLDQGDSNQAEEALRQALPIQRKPLIKDHVATGQTLAALGWALTKNGRPKEGEPYLREAVDICRKGLPKGSWVTADTESRWGASLSALEQYEKAEPLLQSAFTTLKAAPTASPEWWVMGRVPILPCANVQAAPGAPPTATREALERIIKLYEAWGKPDKATQWRAKRLSDAKGQKKAEGMK